MNDPIVIVAPPKSGGVRLMEALASSPDVKIAPGLLDSAIETVCGEQLRVTLETIAALRATVLRESDGRRLVVMHPRNASRVAFMRAVFPAATFVYLYREAAPSVAARTDENRGAEELAREWSETTSLLLDDLEKLPAESWVVVSYRRLFDDPQRALADLAAFLRISWDASAPVTLSEVPIGPLRDAAVVEELTRPVAARARDIFAIAPPRFARSRENAQAMSASAFSSVSTQSFPQILQALGVSLAVSTYQSGRLILVRADGVTLNTHFRMFRSPMGIAVGNGRLAIGTEREVWDYRNMPAVAANVEPRGKHDACFVPRKVHVTGDIRIHEIGFAGGELWLVNTRFSALCTLDRDSSFAPRWWPRFITKLAPEDRCHLNGMAIEGDRVRYVTAFGATDTQGGWRENKRDGGLLLDVESGEVVLRQLSMPHSPRVHDGRFFILESGKGTLATADLATGRVETIVELPGFTRGLAFAGPFAFVGLSQVRETNTFGGIPLTERVAQRECGVYVIDLRSGRTAAFLRFEGDVQEIFDVQVLHGMRYPDLLELTDPLVATSYSVPDESLPHFS